MLVGQASSVIGLGRQELDSASCCFCTFRSWICAKQELSFHGCKRKTVREAFRELDIVKSLDQPVVGRGMGIPVVSVDRSHFVRDKKVPRFTL